MPPVVPRSDRIVRRTAMVGVATAAYLLLTADYGPNYPNPIRNAMESLPLFSKSDTDRDNNIHQAAEQETSNMKPDGTVLKNSSASPTTTTTRNSSSRA